MNSSPPIPLNNSSNEPEGIDLIHFWNLLWGNKLLIIGLGLLFALPTAFIMKGKSSTYDSTASLLIEKSQPKITTIEDLYGIDTQSATYTSTQFELIKSRNIAERVIRNLNLLESSEFVPKNDDSSQETKPKFWKELLPKSVLSFIEANYEGDADNANQIKSEDATLSRVLNNFSRRLTLTPVFNTSIIKVSFSATDPQLAADIANGIANAYIESDMEQRLSATQQASLWLSERVTSLSETLQESERKLQAYMESEDLVDIDGIATLNIQEIDEFNSQLIEAQTKRVQAENIYQQVRSLQSSPISELLALPIIYNHSSIQFAKQNVDNIQQRIAELSNRYGKNHPQIIAIRAEYDSANASLADQVNQLIISFQSDYQTALNIEQNALERFNRGKASLQNINRKSYGLLELEREVNTNRQLYEIFFTRNVETQESNDFNTTTAIIIDPAVPAIFPSGPQRKRAVLLALIAGLMLGSGLILLKEILNNSIKNHNDVESQLHEPVLGVVPFIEREKAEVESGRAYLGFLDDINSRFSESFRTIRTSITLSSLDTPYNIISVTSSVPNEGKSSTAINLASVMGQMGRVLLIDTDLRRPSMERSLGLPSNSPGLSNFLAGNNELKDCLYSIKQAKITIMPSGQIVPNPLELLSSEKFKNLLKTLGTKYSHIILDTPPIQAVSDSLILGTISDAVILVVKADSTSSKIVKSQLSRLRKAGSNVIGVVLNQLDVEKESGHGGYYDSYGYSGNPIQES